MEVGSCSSNSVTAAAHLFQPLYNSRTIERWRRTPPRATLRHALSPSSRSSRALGR